jgi:hypothetical protein
MCPNLKEVQFTGLFTDSDGGNLRWSSLASACSKFSGNVLTFKKTWFESYQALGNVLKSFGRSRITTLHLDRSGMGDRLLVSRQVRLPCMVTLGPQISKLKISAMSSPFGFGFTQRVYRVLAPLERGCNPHEGDYFREQQVAIFVLLRFILNHTKQLMFLEQRTLPSTVVSSIQKCSVLRGRELTKQTAYFLGEPNAIQGYMESFPIDDLIERDFRVPQRAFSALPVRFPNLRIAALRCKLFTSLHVPEYSGAVNQRNPHSLWPAIRRFGENFPTAECILVETENGYNNPEDEYPLWVCHANNLFAPLGTVGNCLVFMVGNQTDGYFGLKFGCGKTDSHIGSLASECQTILDSFSEGLES